jgi:CRISPR-associated protein Cas1
MVKIFIDDFGVFLGKKRNRFTVKKNGDKKEFLADDVESIVLMNPGVTISAGALRLAVDHRVQVVFAKYSGWPYAVLMPISLTGSVRARREQFLAYNDDRGFLLARGFVLGKLINQANLLKLMAKNRKLTNPQLADKLYKAGRGVEEVAGKVLAEKGGLVDEKRQTLMNLEAEAPEFTGKPLGR